MELGSFLRSYKRNVFLTTFGPVLLVCAKSGFGQSGFGLDECECVSTFMRRLSGCRLEKQDGALSGFDAGVNMKTSGRV